MNDSVGMQDLIYFDANKEYLISFNSRVLRSKTSTQNWLKVLKFVNPIAWQTISLNYDMNVIIIEFCQIYDYNYKMTEKSQIGHRQKYIEFRFQQSLRKYEPPPRKVIRMGSSICQNCDRKSCESKRESRLIRLCETRKLYHATSRERASEFSRKKEAIHLSQQKASGNVSDFNCNENNHQDFQESQKQNELQMNQQPNMDDWYHSRYKIESEGMNKLQINIAQTPIKQHIRQELRIKQSELEQSIQESRQRQQINDVKVKDIEFHIGLVQQLHHKINQYIKLESQIAYKSSLHEPSIQQQGQSEDPFIEHMKDEIEMQIEMDVDVDVECVDKRHKEEQSKVICFMSSFNEEKIVFDPRNLELDKVVVDSNADIMKQKAMIEQSNNQSHFCQQKVDLLKQQVNILKQQVGRIQIKGEKGRCLLSARIMKKLLTGKISPNKVKRTLLRHHPYLEDISCLLKMTFQKIREMNP